MRDISLHGWMQINFCHTFETVSIVSVSLRHLNPIPSTHIHEMPKHKCKHLTTANYRINLDSDILAKASNTLPLKSKLGDLITLASIISLT